MTVQVLVLQVGRVQVPHVQMYRYKVPSTTHQKKEMEDWKLEDRWLDTVNNILQKCQAKSREN
jgi:hypothetical protein